MVMSLLCLISSYFYLYMACFRFSQGETSDKNKTMSAIFEVIFLVYALIQFFKDDNDDINSNDRKKLFRETSKEYFKGNFIYDVIPLIPLQLTTFSKNRDRLFFLVKTLRIVQGFRLFDVRNLDMAVKKTNRL